MWEVFIYICAGDETLYLGLPSQLGRNIAREGIVRHIERMEITHPVDRCENCAYQFIG